MKVKRISIFLVVILLLVNCTIEPQKIEYGHDGCSYCTMTIVDKKHAAQIVTNKGKVYKYDSIECLIKDAKNHIGNEIAFKKVTDFSSIDRFVDAESATYLISPEIPSPMGENLSAFSSKKDAESMQENKKGELFDWNSVQQRIK